MLLQPVIVCEQDPVAPARKKAGKKKAAAVENHGTSLNGKAAQQPRRAPLGNISNKRVGGVVNAAGKAAAVEKTAEVEIVSTQTTMLETEAAVAQKPPVQLPPIESFNFCTPSEPVSLDFSGIDLSDAVEHACRPGPVTIAAGCSQEVIDAQAARVFEPPSPGPSAWPSAAAGLLTPGAMRMPRSTCATGGAGPSRSAQLLSRFGSSSCASAAQSGAGFREKGAHGDYCASLGQLSLGSPSRRDAEDHSALSAADITSVLTAAGDGGDLNAALADYDIDVSQFSLHLDCVPATPGEQDGSDTASVDMELDS